jgi:PTS system fructose-specific IIC component
MKKIVAITACPTGIAHTYMAAETLELAAKKAGILIKVETHGAIGVENKLTDIDIEVADVVILANDISIDEKRFEGKKIYKTSTTEAIRNASGVISTALSE